MKKNLIIVVMLLAVNSLLGQVVITPLIPPGGPLQREQLWSIILVNTTSNQEIIRIQLSVINKESAEMLLLAQSTNIALSPGSKQIQFSALEPITYNYGSNEQARMLQSSGFLPFGQYSICYRIIEYKSNSLLTEDCIDKQVQSFSPPHLSTPPDNSVLKTVYPLLSWIPPVPITIFNHLNYDLSLVEVMDGQSPNDAIKSNIPIFNPRHLNNLNIQYSFSASPLQLNKTYAWQVTAKDNDQFIAYTETWTFTIKKDSINPNIIPIGNAYPRLKRDLDAGYYSVKDNLKFEYVNETTDSILHFSIFDLSAGDNKRVPIKNSNPIKIVRGQNFITFDLTKEKSFFSNKTYLLEVYNSRKETWKLKFKYIQ